MWGREGELGSLGRDDVGESKDGFISSVPSHSRALTRAFIRNQCVNECYPIDARGNARLAILVQLNPASGGPFPIQYVQIVCLGRPVHKQDVPCPGH